MRRTVAHASTIGAGLPIQIQTFPLSDLLAQLAAHEAARPDHLAATAPDAPQHLRDAWLAWCETKGHLDTKIAMAKSAENNVWRDADGNVVPGITWRGGLRDLDRALVKKAMEKKKATMTHSEAGKLGGRPRSDNPSREALQRREQRARRRA
jgi:hypothetical protein